MARVEDDVRPPDGYAAIALGASFIDRDRRLRVLAEAEVKRPAWQAYDPAVRAAFVRLYGRAAPPEKVDSWADRQAVRAAMSIRHECDDDIERDAIVGEDIGG